MPSTLARLIKLFFADPQRASHVVYIKMRRVHTHTLGKMSKLCLPPHRKSLLGQVLIFYPRSAAVRLSQSLPKTFPFHHWGWEIYKEEDEKFAWGTRGLISYSSAETVELFNVGVIVSRVQCKLTPFRLPSFPQHVRIYKLKFPSAGGDLLRAEVVERSWMEAK